MEAEDRAQSEDEQLGQGTQSEGPEDPGHSSSDDALPKGEDGDHSNSSPEETPVRKKGSSDNKNPHHKPRQKDSESLSDDNDN
jgi:hypothetical protein